jgi:AcrR family transcriptional regulator
MSSRERRDRERVELRGLIMDTARRLFAAEGYTAVSMRRIADAIEYSPAAIYVHFKDKQSLIRELCTDDFAALAQEFLRLAHVTDPVERIRQAGHLYIRFAIRHPNHYRLMFMTESDPAHDAKPTDKDHGDPERDAYAFLHYSVQEAIAAGRIRPELTDSQLVAQTFWAVVHGVASLQITKSSDPWIKWANVSARATCAIDAAVAGLTCGTPASTVSKPAATRRKRAVAT